MFLEGTEEDVAKATVADERDFFLRMIQVQMIVLFFIEGQLALSVRASMSDRTKLWSDLEPYNMQTKSSCRGSVHM